MENKSGTITKFSGAFNGLYTLFGSPVIGGQKPGAIPEHSSPTRSRSSELCPKRKAITASRTITLFTFHSSLIIAAILWTVMFSPWTAPKINFWWAMTASALLLTSLVILWSRDTFRTISFKVSDIFLGIGIAIALWGIFWLGDLLSSWILPFARDQVNNIYGMKVNQSPWLLTFLLLFIIGPAEEFFWRGFIQRSLSKRLTPVKGFLITTAIYALVHWASFNFMLIMSALVCGLVWGWLYMRMPNRLGAIVLSHALWDAAVFIWFPIG